MLMHPVYGISQMCLIRERDRGWGGGGVVVGVVVRWGGGWWGVGGWGEGDLERKGSEAIAGMFLLQHTLGKAL